MRVIWCFFVTATILCLQSFLYSQSPVLYSKTADTIPIATNFQIYLVGENHKYKMTNNVLTEIWTVLNKKTSVNNIIVEAGVSMEYLMLNFKKGKRTKFYYNKNLAVDVLGENGEKIYKYISKKLYESANLYYVDIEAEPKIANIAILDILSKYCEDEEVNALNNSIHFKIDCLRFNKDEVGISNIILTELKGMLNVIEKTISKIDFYYLKKILNNLEEGIEFHSYKDKNTEYKFREAALYRNIKNLLLEHPNEKFIGSLGQIHVLDTLPNFCFQTICNWASMTYRLKKEFKVCSIVTLYEKKKLRYLSGLAVENLRINDRLLSLSEEDIEFDEKKKKYIYKSLDSLSTKEFNLFKLEKDWIYDMHNHFNYILYCR